MRIFTILFLSFLFNVAVHAQTDSCDGMRYKEDVFSDFTKTSNVKYGENTTFAGVNKELFMDIFEPEGDTAEERPLIIFAFGGSFIGGERASMNFLCEAFAKKGYVTATIDYRVYDGPLFPLPSSDDFVDVAVKAVSDMKAAIRFMKEDAATTNMYRVDTDNVYVGGISAGAITAAHVAMWDEDDDLPINIDVALEANGGFEGNSSNNYEYSSSVDGLINYSGALSEADVIDDDDPAFISFHDDSDPVVPYGEGYASISGYNIIAMEGSLIMHQKGVEEEIENSLHTFENSDGHVSYFAGSVSTSASVINTTADFLFELICDDDVATTNPTLLNVAVTPNPTTGMLQVKGDDIVSVRLYDIIGRSLKSWTNTSNLNISEFEKGMYFLEMKNATQAKQTIKVILE